MVAIRLRRLRASAAETAPRKAGGATPIARFDGFISYSHAVDAQRMAGEGNVIQPPAASMARGRALTTAETDRKHRTLSEQVT